MSKSWWTSLNQDGVIKLASFLHCCGRFSRTGPLLTCVPTALMFPSLGCVSKPVCPSQLPPPASLSRHVRRPSCCQAVCSLCSFSLGKGRAVSLTQLNVSSQKQELKPPPVVSNQLTVQCGGFVPVLVPIQPGSVTKATWMWQQLGQPSLGSVD